MKYPTLFVGTYHKTGTVWIKKVMGTAAKKLDIPFHENLLRETGAGDSVEPGIHFDDHCYFSADIPVEKIIGFRMIRDPRDVVISGAHYHQKAREPWLHVEQESLGGKSYQQAINALDTIQDVYRFEMDHAAGHTNRSMASPNAFAAALAEVRYETLMQDADFSAFRGLMKSLGLTWREQRSAVKAFKKHSLVGDAKSTGSHGTSKGALQRWRTAFDRETAEKFAEHYGEALVVLGYEENQDWVKDCAG
ncbi:MAG: sulfotransferase domain-containing protein [Alphaproteobacteria bacterium]|nr:sulfotransferase domain-containing protein [Alphaproteobacteria bacterium]